MAFLLIILLVQGIVFGAFCSFIAGEKGRGRGNWFVLGFLFSFLAILALIAVPKLSADDLAQREAARVAIEKEELEQQQQKQKQAQIQIGRLSLSDIFSIVSLVGLVGLLMFASRN